MKNMNFGEQNPVYVNDVWDQHKFFLSREKSDIPDQRWNVFWSLSGSFGWYQCGKYYKVEIGICQRI